MHNKTITELAKDLREGKFSSVELTQSYLDRIKKHSELNCFITVAEDFAIENAKRHQLIKETENELRKDKEKLEEALANIKTLRGLLPICMHCKKIRDEKGYWNQLEAYIYKHSDAQFSHSICQDCAKEHYPDLDLYE